MAGKKRKTRFIQGRFVPLNKTKWINCRAGVPILFRSSWERKFCSFLDNNPSVIECGYENVVIPYYNPVKKKICRYMIDFYMCIKDKRGIITTYLIEVKPSRETMVPQAKKGRRKKNLLQEQMTYTVNMAKWKFANEYCARKGWVFRLVTEKELRI